MSQSQDPEQSEPTHPFKKLYENLFFTGSDLMKMEKEELQEFIYENYREFIAMQGEYDQFFKKFGDIKQQFSQFENDLSYIFENVKIVKQNKQIQLQQKQKQLQRAKSMRQDIEDSDKSSDSSDDESTQDKKEEETQGDNYDGEYDDNETNQSTYEQYQQRQKEKKERENIAEQINELLDSISISTFEKEYQQAIKTLGIIKDMLHSEKFSVYLSQQQIRITLEQHYQMLTDALINDLVTENPLTKMLDLLSYLKEIKQTARAAEGYLEVNKRKLGQMIHQGIEKVGKLEGERTEKITGDYVDFVLKVAEQFKEIFLVDQETQYLKAFLSNWINQSCSVFFSCTQQNIFWGSELEDILENIKVISKVLFEKEENKISLNFIIQRLFIDEIQYKMDEMFTIYAQRLTRMQNIDDWQVYPIFTVLNVNFCEDEIQNPKLQPIKFISEIETPENKKAILASQKPVKEVKINDLQKGYQTYLCETQLKGARHSILFWNTIFQLMDKVIDNVDIEQRRVFSAQFVAVVENKILQFLREYVQSFKEVLGSIASCSEDQLLAACANINTSLNLSKLSMEYEVIKLNPHINLFDHQGWKNSWTTQVNYIYQYCHDLLFTYFKFKLLNHIPRLFSDHRKAYTQSKEGQGPQVKSPSSLFLKIASVLENIRDNLSLIMNANDIIFYLNKLFFYINYLIEYVIYWDYHSSNKQANLFFASASQISKLQMDMKEIDVFLANNALEIGFFHKQGIEQFIFDMHFLSTLYNANFAKEAKQEKKINNDDFLNKAVSCFCKKKNLSPKDFQFTFTAVREQIQNYCIKEFKTDISLFISKERESLIKSTQSSSSTSSSQQKTIRERIFAINLAVNNNQ